jgi:hypothetical protein
MRDIRRLRVVLNNYGWLLRVKVNNSWGSLGRLLDLFWHTGRWPSLRLGQPDYLRMITSFRRKLAREEALKQYELVGRLGRRCDRGEREG